MPYRPTRVPEKFKNKKVEEEENQLQAKILAALHKKAKYAERRNSSSSATTSSSSPLEVPSRTFSVNERHMSEMLRRLRETINPEELQIKGNNQVDNGSQDQLAHVAKFLHELSMGAEMDREDDLMSPKSMDRKDDIRLAHLEDMRPKWLTSTLWILFHIMVFANFYISWLDSATILYEEAKMQFWLLEDDFNCLDLVPSADAVNYYLNIFHALLSCSVLYVSTRNNATLCLAWIGSQAAHTIFQTFAFFFNLKFEPDASIDVIKFQGLVWIIIFDAFGSLLLLHKYYDLTDRFGTRSKLAATMTAPGQRSLNAGIIYKNEPAFLQRKTLLREVTVAQTYGVIRKIGKHAKQGLHVDPLTLDREIKAAKMALDDCAAVDNHNMIAMLRRAYVRRLKELEKLHHEGHGLSRDKQSEDNYDKLPSMVQLEMY